MARGQQEGGKRRRHSSGESRSACEKATQTPFAQVLLLEQLGRFEPDPDGDLLEILDDRYNLNSTIITSQLEPKEWHAVIGDSTLADAICDRLVAK
jgi:DNA replication protein DnaC